MKWIGQHIWDFISRFRSDVYLEATETGTVASGGNLGLDANNKIVKTTSDNLSFDGSTAGGVLTYKDADEITVESTFTYTSLINAVKISSSSGGSLPYFLMSNTNTGAVGPLIKFEKTANGADDDVLGTISWTGDDEGGGVVSYASISGRIADATNGEEAGKLIINVAAYDGQSTQGLLIDGDTDADGEVDVTISSGAGSTTTVSGGLTVTGASVIFSNLPTSDPGVSNQLWNDSGTLKISS